MGFYILVDGLSHYFYMGSLACPARFPSINLRPAWALDKIDILGQDFANATCPALIFCLARSALTAAWPCLTLACMDLIRC